MKKSFYLLLAVVMGFFASCSSDETTEDENNDPETNFQIIFDGTAYTVNSVLVTELGLDPQTGYNSSFLSFLASAGDIDLRIDTYLQSSEAINPTELATGSFIFDPTEEAPLFFNDTSVAVIEFFDVIDSSTIEGGEIFFDTSPNGSLFILNLTTTDDRSVIGEYDGPTATPT